MKREMFEFPRGLPDAPLAMPKQALERHLSLRDVLRSMFFAWPRR